MFYLMTHSTHFIYGYMESDVCKGPLRLRERKPAAATTWATLSNMHHPTERIAWSLLHIPWITGWSCTVNGSYCTISTDIILLWGFNII